MDERNTAEVEVEGGSLEEMGPSLSSDDTQPLLVPPPDLAPLDGASEGGDEGEFVAPPEMMLDSAAGANGSAEFSPPEVEPYPEEEEESEEELDPLEVAQTAQAELEKEIKELNGRLDVRAERLMTANRRAVLSSALFIIIVAVYMVWTGEKLKHAFQPDSVADAATGVARDSIPLAAEGLQLMLEDGAADISESFGDSLLEGLPLYREDLVVDLDPAMQALAELMADRMISELLSTPTTEISKAVEGPEQEAVWGRALRALDQRLSLSIAGADSLSRVEAAQKSSEITARGLRRLEEGRLSDHDREILLTWLSVIGHQSDK